MDVVVPAVSQNPSGVGCGVGVWVGAAVGNLSAVVCSADSVLVLGIAVHPIIKMIPTIEMDSRQNCLMRGNPALFNPISENLHTGAGLRDVFLFPRWNRWLRPEIDPFCDRYGHIDASVA